MSNAIYAAVSGAVSLEKTLEILAENLANSQTRGYKAVAASVHAAAGPAENSQASRTGGQVKIGETKIDFTQGDLHHTGDYSDLSLEGRGFFLASDGQREFLVRSASVSLNGKRLLQDQNGLVLQGYNGDIAVPYGADYSIDEQGVVWSSGAILDKLRLVQPADPQQLQRGPKGLFQADERSALFNVNTPIRLGTIERSNSNPIGSMSQLITAERGYQAYTKIVDMTKDNNSKLLQILH